MTRPVRDGHLHGQVAHGAFRYRYDGKIRAPWAGSIAERDAEPGEGHGWRRTVEDWVDRGHEAEE
jgi:hypothetical protein